MKGRKETRKIYINIKRHKSDIRKYRQRETGDMARER